MTDKRTTKSYDNYADKWAKKQRESSNAAHVFLEKPAMYSKLGNLKGLSILCLGCGSGEECEYLLKQGAAKVAGIDLSKGLIEKARYAYPGVDFQVMDMEKLKFIDASFDLVYSSLALHYLKDWKDVLSSVRRVLKPGGRFLFSTHHPLAWGSQFIQNENQTTDILGYKRDKKTNKLEVYGDYLSSRKIKDTWFGELTVVYYNRPISDMFRQIREGEFEVVDLLEPKATEGAKKARPDFYEIHQKLPLFLVFELRKK